MAIPTGDEELAGATDRAVGATYARIAGLPVVIERCELLPLVRDTTGGFTKVSLVVRLSGAGEAGVCPAATGTVPASRPISV